MEAIGTQLLFKYFLIVGVGLGIGLSITVFPAMMIKEKMMNGGFKLWRRQR